MNLNDDVQAISDLRRVVAAGEPNAIARVAMENAWPLYSSHFDELVAAVESLPSAVLERYPVLRVLHRMTPVLARTTRPFKPLVSPEAARSMSADELDLITLVQMVAFRFSGDVAAALIYARRLEERILQSGAEARDRVDGPLWFYHHQIGSTLLAAGDTGRALLEFATACQLGRLAPQVDAERIALGRKALAHAARGSLEDAELALAEATAQPSPTRAHETSCRMTEHTAAALIAVERMPEDIDDVLAGLEPYDSIELTWPFALLARTRSLLARRRPDEALEAARLASGAHPSLHGAFGSDVVNATAIEALAAMGDTAAAQREAEMSARSGLLSTFAGIRLALQLGQLESAAQRLRRVSAHRSLGPGARAEIQLLDAWLEMLRRDALAGDTVRQVARLATKNGTRRLLATMPRQLMEIVCRSLPPGDAEAFCQATVGLEHLETERRPVLTTGELRVLSALPVYETTAAIASAFHVSPNTVKSHLKSMYRKLGCSTRAEAIAIAARLRLIADPQEHVAHAGTSSF